MSTAVHCQLRGYVKYMCFSEIKDTIPSGLKILCYFTQVISRLLLSYQLL